MRGQLWLVNLFFVLLVFLKNVSRFSECLVKKSFYLFICVETRMGVAYKIHGPDPQQTRATFECRTVWHSICRERLPLLP